MQIHNPSNQSYLCVSLGENLEAYEVRDVPDEFVPCSDCRCVESVKASKKDAAKGKS
ncbi:MAG: hypothetical protein NVS3B1_30070 [Marmoricola sp.]